MQLQIKGLAPLPLREKIAARPSDIWLRDLSFSKAEHISVVAPSGTGKTTLVSMLYGLRDDYDGSILWGGKELKSFTGEDLANLRSRNVSVIFQDMRLFPQLTAWENLEVKRSLTNSVSQEEAASWMERLGIGDKKNALARTMSYGEQQRLSIVRALLMPFTFLLMDEPFSHLDMANTAKAASLIDEVVRRNNASSLLADLDENNFFNYGQKLFL